MKDALMGMQLELMGSISGNKTKITDVYSNPDQDLGFGTSDPIVGSVYPQARSLTWNLVRIEAVMRADPFFNRALEYRSSKPLINGIDISSEDIDASTLSDLQDAIEDKLNPSLREGLYEGDAFGWSGLLIMIDGEMNKTALKRPLNLKEIKKGKFLGLKPLTRWYQINPSQDLIHTVGEKNQIFDPRELGTPEYYNISFEGDRKTGTMYQVHKSRLIIIARNKLSFIEKKVEHYGGTSLLEQCFESLSRYHTLVAQINRILNKTVIPVLKLDDIASSALQTKNGQKIVERKIELIRDNIGSNNLIVLGNEDDISFEEANLSGFGEQLRERRLELAAAMNTPPEELFHEEQKHEKKIFKSFLRDRQENVVKPIYKKLIPALYLSEFGKEMPKYKLTFKPIEELTTKETAEARKTNIEALELLYKANIIDKKTFQDSLSDIDRNPSDILRNLNVEYREYVSGSGEMETWNLDQIRLALALNKDGEGSTEEKVEGRMRGGDPKDTEKPTSKLAINKGKED